MGGDVRALAIVAVFATVIASMMPLLSAGTGSPPSAASGPGPQPAYTPFAPNVKVNNVNLGYNYEVEPTMAIDSTGKIYVGWKEAFTATGGGQRVAFAYSTDGGDTFSTNVLMNVAQLALQSDPWLTVTRDDRVYFTRIEYTNTASAGGFTVTNTTDGVNWGTDYFYDDQPAFADKESAAHDAAGNLYVVWNSDFTAYPVVFSRSNDGGRTWTPKVQISDNAQNIGAIVKVGPDGTVYATWSTRIGNNVMFDRSFDGGRTWGTDIRVNDIPGSAPRGPFAQPVLPSMVIAPNGTVFVAWEDSRNGNIDVMESHSSDHGTTWSPAVRMNDDNTTEPQWMPDLTLDPFGTLHAAWEDDRTGNHNIYYANSTDGGVTWGPNVRVTTAETPVTYTRPGDYLAIRSAPDGTICIVWTDGRGPDLDIYFAKLPRTVGYTIDTAPSGLQVSVDGALATTPAAFAWSENSTHDVSAPSPQYSSPQSRWVFDSWSDSGGQSHSVRVGPTGGTVVAAFHAEDELTVRTSPVPLPVVIDGTPTPTPVSNWWQEGSPHNMSIVSPQAVGPGARYTFQGWADGGPMNRSMTVSAPATFEADFRLEYLLTVVSQHGTPTGGGWYRAGDVANVSVPANVAGPPGTRYRFLSWSGDSTEPTPNASVVMAGPKVVVAMWLTEYALTLRSDHGIPMGAGWYAEGSDATVSVEDRVTEANVTYVFTGWTGDVTNASSVVIVRMDGPRTLTATWEVAPPGGGGPAQTPVIDWPWLLLALVAVFVVAILLFVVWRRRRKKDDPRPPPPPG